MLLQLQFIANGIIGLLSRSITSLLKLISMIIHWNHHENTLSWWVFTSQCSSRKRTHPYKKACYPKYHNPLSLCTSAEQCIVIFPQFWKTQCPFLETVTWLHFNPQFPRNGKCKLKSPCRHCYKSKCIEHVQVCGPISVHPFVQHIFIQSP